MDPKDTGTPEKSGKKLEGKIEEFLGDLAGDREAEAEGKAKQAEATGQPVEETPDTNRKTNRQ